MDCALVQGDARLLHRALLNLGWNGIRHGLHNGTVTLSLQATPAAYVLAVHDQGAGFALDPLAHLSQRYTQAVQSAPTGQASVALTASGADTAAAKAATAAAEQGAGQSKGQGKGQGKGQSKAQGAGQGAGHGLGLALARLVAAKHHAT